MSRTTAITSLLLVAVLAGCSGGTGDGGMTFSYRLDPAPPIVGTANLELRLVDAQGQPIRDASVQVEANMNHAGMVPTFSSLVEADAGRYDGTVEFTMAGDWFLLVEAKLADGRTVERALDVRGVRGSP